MSKRGTPDQNKQATTRKSTPAYGRKPTRTAQGRDDDGSVRRATEMQNRLKKFNGDWSSVALKKATVKNSPGQSTDYE